MSECLRPECRREIIGVGVCFSCANADWEPKADGIELETLSGERVKTEGHW